MDISPGPRKERRASIAPVNRRCPACGTVFPDEVAFCGHDGTVTIRVPEEGVEPDARLGERLGKYIVSAHIADGAMGAVYEARNGDTRERVAIKVLHPDVEQDEIAVERFKREYETADMFQHPHIVKVLDFGETVDSQHYMTMEYLEGQELGELLRAEGALSPARTLRVLSQVALALEHAHEFGVIHRDLKPGNVYLSRGEDGEDDVRLLDFGSVKLQVETGPKLTAFGTTLGSPYYMSPEQAKGLPDVDTRTDVFAVGALLYEMLSGRIAFEAPTVAQILMKIVREMPDPIHSLKDGLPPRIHAVIEKAIAKKKTERYDTPVALMDAALEAFGVSGGAEHWAQRPTAELEEALRQATAPSAAGPAAPGPAAPGLAPGPAAPGPAAPGPAAPAFQTPAARPPAVAAPPSLSPSPLGPSSRPSSLATPISSNKSKLPLILGLAAIVLFLCLAGVAAFVVLGS